MSHLELELPKRELWGWLFDFFSSFPALENSVIWCQMTAIVFATRALRKERRAVCVITSSLIWKLPGD